LIARASIRSSEDRADAHRQLLRHDRLDHVVVRAQ
jgi:hypothetical protein